MNQAATGTENSLLRAESISVGYPNQLVMEALSVAIETGRGTALVGPNGSGKSTLLKAMARLLPVSAVATGEHEYTKFGFRDLIARGGADIVQPDIGRVGGVTEWLKVAHLAQAFNLPVAPHAYQLVHLHVACAIPNLRIVEYLGIVEEFDKIVYTEFPQPKEGMWSPDPDKPGLGLSLNPEIVQKYGS